MNMNFKSLLLGTSLSLIPNLTQAQCVASTDCATLGYTETSCPDGKGIRCPFGTTYACSMSETKFCDKYGFKYECKGTGYASGIGQNCNNKYTSCTCTAGYEWEDGKCEKEKPAVLGQCTGYAKNCKIGDILNSDGTCTTDKVSGKTPLGFVIYISGDSNKCGYAMTASPVEWNVMWSSELVDTGAFQSSDWSTAIKDFDVNGNMKHIIQAANGDSSKYPAAYAALNYVPSAAPTTKGKWALPTAGILNNLYMYLNTVNNAISKIDGEQLTSDNEDILSSSECSTTGVWAFGIGYIGGLGRLNKNYPYGDKAIRPVIAF